MSHYINDKLRATTRIHKRDFEKLLIEIKKEISKNDWNHYGWQKNALNSRTLEDVAEMFDIKLINAGDEYYRPAFEDTYASTFFSKLKYIAAPYMENGFIFINDEFNDIMISFNNHDVEIAYGYDDILKLQKKGGKNL